MQLAWSLESDVGVGLDHISVYVCLTYMPTQHPGTNTYVTPFLWIAAIAGTDVPQGPGRGAGVQGRGQAPMPAPSGMSKDQKRNAKAMAKLDKQVQAEKPRVYKPLGEEERLEAARCARLVHNRVQEAPVC